MQLLLDQGLPRSAASLLRAAEHDAVHVGEIGASTAEDAALLQMARDEKRTIVTLDADFHMLLALSGATLPSVIRIRIEGVRAEALVALLKTVFAQCAEDLQQGAVVTVQEDRLRVRRLPLIRQDTTPQD